MRLTEKDIIEFLQHIETGEIKLTPLVKPSEVYAGNVPYGASNGWYLVIFNDCNEWDYIDMIVTPHRRILYYRDIAETMPNVNRYVPPEDIARKIYRIPGYLNQEDSDEIES